MTDSNADLVIRNILPRLMGSLSFIGSCIIIHKILRYEKEKLSNPYQRLLLCLSIFDVFSSFSYIWGVSALPKEVTYIPNARGTFTTCRIQGYFFQLGTGVPFYFFFLTCYFLCSIKYGMKNQYFSKKLEPFMHMVGFLFPFGTASTGLALKLFNPIINGCWIAEYPIFCSKPNSPRPCIYGKNAETYRWLFGSFVYIFLILIPINMFLLYRSVKKPANKMKKYQGASGGKIDSDKRLRSRKTKLDERTQAVAHQAISFFVAYLIVWIWPIIFFLSTMYSKNSTPPVWISVLYNIFFPLQGFLNYFVYIRPIALKLRKRNQTFSFLKCVLLESFYPGALYPSHQKHRGHKNGDNSTLKVASGSSGTSSEYRVSRVRCILHLLGQNDIPIKFRNKSESESNKQKSKEKHVSDSKSEGLSQSESNSYNVKFSLSAFSHESKSMEPGNNDTKVNSSLYCASVNRNTSKNYDALTDSHNHQSNLDNREEKKSMIEIRNQDLTLYPEEIRRHNEEAKQMECPKRRISIGELDFPGIALFQNLDLPEIDIDEAILRAIDDETDL